MGKIANMYLDWNIMVVNGHRMVDELVARRAIDIAKEELELQQDVVQRDAPSAPIELCGLLRASAILMTSAIAQSWPARVSPATIGPRRWTTKEATMRVAYI